MSDEEDVLQKVRTRFEDLCRALNMDEEASTEAWKSYENISRNFTLEVSPHTAGGTPALPGVLSAGSVHSSPRSWRYSSGQPGSLCPGAPPGLKHEPHLDQPKPRPGVEPEQAGLGEPGEPRTSLEPVSDQRLRSSEQFYRINPSEVKTIRFKP